MTRRSSLARDVTRQVIDIMGKFPKQADMCVDVGNAIEEEEKQMIIHIPRYFLKYPSFSVGRRLLPNHPLHLPPSAAEAPQLNH